MLQDETNGSRHKENNADTMNATESKPNFRFVAEADAELNPSRFADSTQSLDWFRELHSKVARLFQTRVSSAQARFRERTQKALSKMVGELAAKPLWPWDLWLDCSNNALDCWQRTILFWDALRQRHPGLVIDSCASGGRRIRRVSEVAVLEPLARGYDRCTIASWRPADDAFDVLTTPAQINAIARRLGIDDAAFLDGLARRERFLEELLRDGADEIDDVQARILAFSGHPAPRS